jgi:hypothetical protein
VLFLLRSQRVQVSADPQAITPTTSKDAGTDHLICSHLRREEPARSSRHTERLRDQLVPRPPDAASAAGDLGVGR